MPPATSRDFQKAAGQRLTAALFLRDHRYTLDAQYLGGYTVECSLKSLILEKTPVVDRPSKLTAISSGARMHSPIVLLGELHDLGVTLPTALRKRMKKFRWTTDLRYDSGKLDFGETVAFLNTAQAIYDWVEVQLP